MMARSSKTPAATSERTRRPGVSPGWPVRVFRDGGSEYFLNKASCRLRDIQALFAGLDPWGIPQKFRAFARLDPASSRAALFVALEDWLNDGVPLAAPVARETLGGWYGANTTARLTWRVAGAVMDPAALAVPAFLAIPRRDRIVPPASARALARRLPPGAALHEAAAGHIGMVAGTGAEAALWRPLLSWLRGL